MSFAFATVYNRRQVDDYFDRLSESNPAYVYGIDSSGREYARVWRSLRGQSSRSAVGFLDVYGNLYRADSWKKRGRLIGHVQDLGGVHTPSRDRRRPRATGPRERGRSRVSSRRQAGRRR